MVVAMSGALRPFGFLVSIVGAVSQQRLWVDDLRQRIGVCDCARRWGHASLSLAFGLTYLLGRRYHSAQRANFGQEGVQVAHAH